MKTHKIALPLFVALLTATSQAADSGLKESVLQKLERIVIPELEIRDATLRDAVDLLKKKSTELDVDSPAAEQGVNIILKFDTGTGGGGLTKDAPAAPVADPADARMTVS